MKPHDQSPPHAPHPQSPSRPLLAYHDPRFLDGDQARPLRILAEYIGPHTAFEQERVRDTIVFFGSARTAPDGPFGRYYEDARSLATMVTRWSLTLSKNGDQPHCQRFLVCSGGGPGIMEAANRGAHEAGGNSIGLNIGLPHEQKPNRYIPRALSFEFHYFFMRKLWFAHLARALIVFPGGFGTLDELSEILTLQQTGKIDRKIPVILYGPSFWKEVINFDALVRHGMIAADDLALIRFADTPEEAFTLLKDLIGDEPEEMTPAFASSTTPPVREDDDAATG